MNDMKTLARKGFYISRCIDTEVSTLRYRIIYPLCDKPCRIDNEFISKTSPTEEDIEYRNGYYSLYGGTSPIAHRSMR